MKLVKSKDGSSTIVVAKKEWETIGREQGWLKEAQININDNIAVLVDSARKGFDIAAFKVNPYNGVRITPEEIATAQQQLGQVPNVQYPQVAPQPLESEVKESTLKAAETEDELKKEAKWGKDIDVEQPGKWTNYSKEELIKKRDAAKKRQEGREKADPKDTELLRELNFAIRAKGDWGKAD